MKTQMNIQDYSKAVEMIAKVERLIAFERRADDELKNVEEKLSEVVCHSNTIPAELNEEFVECYDNRKAERRRVKRAVSEFLAKFDVAPLNQQAEYYTEKDPMTRYRLIRAHIVDNIEVTF